MTFGLAAATEGTRAREQGETTTQRPRDRDRLTHHIRIIDVDQARLGDQICKSHDTLAQDLVRESKGVAHAHAFRDDVKEPVVRDDD